MSFPELREAIAQGGGQATLARFMRSYKFALPTTCLILGLIGLALGASNRRDARFTSFAVGLAVILVYYILLYGARSFANGGRLNPDWAPWIPNIVMAAAGAVLLMWRSQWADLPLKFSIPTFWRRMPPDTGDGSASARRPRAVLVIRIPHLNLPAPRLLDVYIGRQYLRVFVLGVVSLLAIFYISTFIDLIDKLFRGDTTTKMLLQFFYYQTPQFVYFIIPMSVLVSALVTIGVLTKNNELMVMRACGISLYRTAAPLIVFALVASALLYGVQEKVLAHTRREADRLERIIRKWPPLSSPLNRRWAVGADGHVYHYDFFDPGANRFSQLHIYRLDATSWTLRGVAYAREATPVGPAEGEDSHSLIPWTLRQGWERELSSNASPGGAGRDAITMKYTPFVERERRLEAPDYFKGANPEPDMMTYADLGDFVTRLEASGADSSSYRVALRRKIAFPLVTVIMTMLAIPFAAATGRRGALYGIGAAITIGIIYYISQSMFGAIGVGGLLPPLLAAWAPNLMFGAVALYLILTVRT